MRFPNDDEPAAQVESTLSKPNMELGSISDDQPEKTELKAYKKRWLILALFVLYSSSNAFQWTQLVIITNILENYYQVSTFAVSWTSLLFMVTYIPLIFPASWLLQRKGLRICVLLGSFGTCLGSWIKLAGTSRDQFPIVFTGQAIVAVSQIFILGMPSQLAATWFPSNQVSSACAIGVFGNQLGVALGFIVPVEVVRNQEDESKIDQIGSDLFHMFLTVGIITSVIFALNLIFFSNNPPTPPSRAQEVALGTEENSNQIPAGAETEPSSGSGYVSSIKRLVSNRGYLILLITYGLNVGVFYAISTLLNTVIVKHFPGGEQDAGRIGLLIVVCGMAGSMVCGIILDKTHQYKPTTLVVYLFSLIGMLVYTFTIHIRIEVVYATASMLGFFMTGYLPVGFEFAAEITFPESEGTSSGLLNASAQTFGIICTLIAERLLTLSDDDRIANGMLAGVLLIGFILTSLIKPDYRRQAATKPTERTSLVESKK